MSEKLLSIVVPTWNRFDTLVKLYNSCEFEFLGVQAEQVELVIVDNHSDDEIFSQIEAYFGEQKNVRLIRNSRNLGMVKNWNEAIRNAHGEWICFMCSDDYFKPGAVLKILHFVQKQKAPILFLQDPSQDQVIFLSKNSLRKIKLPLASGNFWHKSMSAQLGGYNEELKYSPDAEYWYRLAKYYDVCLINENLATYVQHENNLAFWSYKLPDFLDQLKLINSLMLDLYEEHYDFQTKERILEEQTIETIKNLSIVCLLSENHKKTAFIYIRKVLKGHLSNNAKLKFIIWLFCGLPVVLVKKFIKRYFFSRAV